MSNILSGHYGKTVRTAGNNMAAGATIVCASCHDQVSVEHNFGANVVMAKGLRCLGKQHPQLRHLP